jgi:hypothetical protein
MSEWIKINEKLPGVSEEILLFVKQYRSDSGYFWGDHIIKGFWSDECEDDKEGFYIENYTFELLGDPENPIDGVCAYEFIGYGSKYIRITHWMPLPEPPKG